jgi:predicted nucleic acid-binding protein
LLDRIKPYCDWLDPIFAAVVAGDASAVFSIVTEAEVRVGPLRNQRGDELDRISTLLSHHNVRVINASREIARTASVIRADLNLDLPHAIIVATAVISGCDALIGNDKTCARRVTEIPYIYLDEVVKA